MKNTELFFITSMGLFALNMFAIVLTLAFTKTMGVPASVIFNYSLVFGLVGGLFALIIKALKKP